jgi:nicotinamidase-related amidase
MAGSTGSERVGYLGKIPIEYVDNKKLSTDDLTKLVDKDQFHIVIRKQSLDAFENPNTNRLIKLIKPKAMVVFGVALDFCVYYVLRGLVKHPDVKLHLLIDAVKGLGSRPEEEILDEFRQMRVEITDFEELKRQL